MSGMRRTRFECADPILRVEDMSAAVRYYVDVLGFEQANWGDDSFTCVSRDGAGIYLSQGSQGNVGSWVWVGVADAEALYEELKASAPGSSTRRPTTRGPSRCAWRTWMATSCAWVRTSGKTGPTKPEPLNVRSLEWMPTFCEEIDLWTAKQGTYRMSSRWCRFSGCRTSRRPSATMSTVSALR